MNRKIFIKVTLFCSFIVAAFISQAYAQESKIGDFDINKVREAVKTGLNDTGTTKTDNPDQNNITRPIRDSYMMVTFRIIGYLVLLTLIIVVGVWLIKRFGLSGSSRIGGGSMDLLEALPVGQNRSIVLVRVMDTVLVLSQTSQSITLLEKIEGNEAVELIASTKGGTSILQFKDVFNNFIGKIKKT